MAEVGKLGSSIFRVTPNESMFNIVLMILVDGLGYNLDTVKIGLELSLY